MKNSYFLFFILLNGIFIYSSCKDSIVSPSGPDLHFRQAQAEMNFYNDPDLRAEGGAVVILNLEDLNTPPELLPPYDLDEIGTDVIPYRYTETAEHNFRRDVLSGISVSLVNENTHEVFFELKPGINEAAVIIPAGDYLLYIESLRNYGSDSLGRQVIFIQPDSERRSQQIAGSDNVLFDWDDLNTLITTNNCPGCNLNFANLRNMDLKGADLRDAFLFWADLRGSDLSDANMTNTYLQRADLGNAKLILTKLQSADLFLAQLPNATMTAVNLSNANLRSADLRNTDMRFSILRNSIFSVAYLKSANLVFADLRDANFSNSFLIDANLSFADIRGANFCNADKRGIIADGAVSNSSTQCWP